MSRGFPGAHVVKTGALGLCFLLLSTFASCWGGRVYQPGPPTCSFLRSTGICVCVCVVWFGLPCVKNATAWLRGTSKSTPLATAISRVASCFPL